MMTRSRAELLVEADTILAKANLSREDTARPTSILELADALTDKTDLQRRAIMARRDRELGREPEEVREVHEPASADVQWRNYLAGEQRALGVATDAGGNYLVPTAFSDRLEIALKNGDGIIDASTLFTPSRGTAFNFPVLEDTSTNNVATIVSENTISISGPDLVFAAVAFGKCPMWRRGLFAFSTELASDSFVNVSNLVADAAGGRLAKGIGTAMVTTLLAGSTNGVTAASATAVTPDELISFVDSVDSAYGDRGAWAMKSSTYRTILKLKASTGGSFMFEAERDDNNRPLLLGFPVYICPSMPAMTTSLNPIVFGDLSKLLRRQVANSLDLKVLTERYAEFSQIAYELTVRSDSALMKTASSQPTKYITMA